MKVEATKLNGVLILTPPRFGDHRGHFSETWNRTTLDAKGVSLDFVQDNESLSAPSGTVRGLHFQAPPRAQDKLVRVVKGAIYDVAVDIRKGSPTYGEWVGTELSEDNAAQLMIPKGFLHGFVTRAPDTLVLYKCTDTYAPETEGAVHFADPDLAIDWGIAPDQATVSGKDGEAGSFADFQTPFVYEA